MLAEFQQKHPNDVRLVHKLYVLPKHAQYGEPAARAAVAALKQGKYWQMERALFDDQEKIEHAEITVDDVAKKVGLDMKRYAADVASKETADAVARDMKQADEAGLHATPFLMLNGRHFDQDYFRFDELEAWLKLEAELAKK
jgi:protein-disulfide isomerase